MSAHDNQPQQAGEPIVAGLSYEAGPSFREWILGTRGTFETPSGRVGYLLTRARLGAIGTDQERRLADRIVPFREVIPARELEFAQLLQRDIDDFRVADKLVPYLLQDHHRTPAMFPPILCLILPFEGPRLVERFPERSEVALYTDRGLSFEGWRVGDAFQVEQLVQPDGRPYPMSVGRLSWNEERARVVVLDGQHRAMALLAIQRTATRTWELGSGSAYRVFYESTVERLLDERGGELPADVQVPVTICWFEETQETFRPHQAARQLFVDVNKEAKAPSNARLTLLSESELLSIFARSLLELLRANTRDGTIPLAAVEFDNPEAESSRPVKWSVTTTLDFIKHAIQRTVFGPRTLIEQPLRTFSRGPMARKEMDRFMRQQLELVNLLPTEIEDGDRRIARDQIGNTTFPQAQLDRIVGAFQESWGRALIVLLSDLLPYAAHHRALARLDAGWDPDETQGKLAKDAIFEGVGQYWTLRNSYRNWTSLERPVDRETPVVSAWRQLERRKEEFEALRAEELGHAVGIAAGDGYDVADVTRLYRTLNTAAFQVGAAMTIASIALEAKVARDGVAQLARDVVAAANAGLATQVGPERLARLWMFDPRTPGALNQINEMSTSAAVYFRYFVLELLNAPEASAQLADEVAEAVRALLPDARSLYLQLLEKQEQSVLERSVRRRLTLRQIEVQAERAARESLRNALERWVGLEAGRFDAWLEGIQVADDAEGDELLDDGDD